MKPNPPSELEQYRYDRTSSQTPMLARMLGWLSLLAFVIAVYSTFFLSGERMILMCYISYGGFLILFSAYVFVKIVKRHTRCHQCQQKSEGERVESTENLSPMQAEGVLQVGRLKGTR